MADPSVADGKQSAADRTLVIERDFPATPERVFEAWTDPAVLIRWWGPEGMGAPECEMDVGPGGTSRTEMASPRQKSSKILPALLMQSDEFKI